MTTTATKKRPKKKGAKRAAKRTLAKPTTKAGAARAQEHPERSVPCPHCRAKVGSPCRSPSGYTLFGGAVHKERLRALEPPAEPAQTALPLDGSDRTCPECGAGPGEECRTASGKYLARRKVGRKLVASTHAARRTFRLDLEDAADRDVKPDNVLAGRAEGAALYHARSPFPARDVDTAACSVRVQLVGPLLPAASVPAASRCKRQGCAQLWPEAPEGACIECQHAECPIVPDCGGCPRCAEERAPTIAQTLARELEPRTGPPITVLAVAGLRRDGGTQTRAAIDPTTVEEYAEAYRCGARLPPLIAFFDGREYWLADGFHRAAALELAGVELADVEVRQGTRRDAVLCLCGANETHGLRRTRADRRRAVETLLRDEEWTRKSDRWIAETCGVSPTTVGTIRAEVEGQVSNLDTSAGDLDAGAPGPAPRMREGQDGKLYPATRPSSDASSSPAGATDPDVDRCVICAGVGLEGGCPGCGAGEAIDWPENASPVDERREPESEPAPAPPAKRRPREVLELGPGPIDPKRVLEQHARLHAAALSGYERAELDKARRMALSQWETDPGLADQMAALAGVADMDAPLVLEPSAGTGQLVAAVFRANAVDAVVLAAEIDPVPIARLREIGRTEGWHRLTILEGNFLEMAAEPDCLAPRRGRHGWRADVAISNTPYEGGLDGAFLQAQMALCPRIVALLRLNALTGDGRCERVWSQVQDGPWHLTDANLLRTRPEFVGPGDDTARSDYVVVKLQHESVLTKAERQAETRVRWW